MRLAGAGHRDVFEYGWSAFVEALEAEVQRRDERMKDAALALRVALQKSQEAIQRAEPDPQELRQCLAMLDSAARGA